MVRDKIGNIQGTYSGRSRVKDLTCGKRPQEWRLAVIWVQPRYYRLCTVLPPAGIIVKDNRISRSDSGGSGDDR